MELDVINTEERSAESRIHEQLHDNAGNDCIVSHGWDAGLIRPDGPR